MPIELRTQRDGSFRDTWYGRYELNGKRFYLNLGVKVAGSPPASRSLRDTGDTMFERSRAMASAKLDSIVEEAKSKRNAAHLVEKLYEMKTGEKLDSVKLSSLEQEWLKIPRTRPAKARYASECQAALKRFASAVQAKHPKVAEIGQVTRNIAREYMEAESKRGVTPRTWNGTLKLLRSTFRHLLPPGCVNPFADVPVRNLATVFRKPFTPDELKAILDAAKDDKFMRPLLVTGVCTAMRRGDCCLLKWSDVDLDRRFLTVKTAKTGQTVSIPIFPLLVETLQAAAQEAGAAREGYVFPKQAEMYLKNPDGITWRVQKAFAAAGFKDIEENDAVNGKAAETKPQADADVFDVEVCNYDGGATTHRGELHVDRKEGEGLRRASVRDFHSFRVTWVTLALTAGVPLELVQKVTGHQTTDVVLKHYFQPGREDFRQALHSAMPKLLTQPSPSSGAASGQKSAKDEAREIVEAMTAKNLKKDKARLLALLEKV